MKPTHILVDIDTQQDFLGEKGTHPITNRKALIANIRRVFAMARSYHIPVISSVDTHRKGDWFAGVPQHCIEGSCGQTKLHFTLLRNHTLIDANNTLDLPPDLTSNFRQIILRKRTPDFLENPKADRLFSALVPESFIIFGVGLERSIKKLALSLIARGKQVAIVPEACGFWNETDADLARRLVSAKSGALLNLNEVKDALKEAASRRRVAPLISQSARRNRSRSNNFRSLAS